MGENFGGRKIGRENETREIKRQSEVVTEGERAGDKSEMRKCRRRNRNDEEEKEIA